MHLPSFHMKRHWQVIQVRRVAGSPLWTGHGSPGRSGAAGTHQMMSQIQMDQAQRHPILSTSAKVGIPQVLGARGGGCACVGRRQAKAAGLKRQRSPFPSRDRSTAELGVRVPAAQILSGFIHGAQSAAAVAAVGLTCEAPIAVNSNDGRNHLGHDKGAQEQQGGPLEEEEVARAGNKDQRLADDRHLHRHCRGRGAPSKSRNRHLQPPALSIRMMLNPPAGRQHRLVPRAAAKLASLGGNRRPRTACL